MENKKKLVILVFAAILLPGKVYPGGRGELSAKKANAELYLKTHIIKLQEEGKRRIVDPNNLSQIMLENPSTYKKRESAWKVLQQAARNSFANWYQSEVNIALKTVGENYFSEEEQKSFLQCPDQVSKDFLDKNFGGSISTEGTNFDVARKKACQEQAKKLVGDIDPDESDFDKAADDKGLLENLKKDMLEKLIKKQKESIFSENTTFLSKEFIDPMIKDAVNQRDKQNSIVANSSGGSYFTPRDIKIFILGEILSYQSNLRQEKKKEPVFKKVYNIFSSVNKKAEDRSGEIAI